MEHPVALADGGGTYRWHAGAPDDATFAAAAARARATGSTARSQSLGLEPLALEHAPPLEDDARTSLAGRARERRRRAAPRRHAT